MSYQVLRSTYTGLDIPPLDCEDKEDARAKVASRLRGLRRQGFPVVTLTRGKRWEIQERTDAGMVHDACGTISIRHKTYECRECGSDCESLQDARDCCAYVDELDMELPDDDRQEF